MLPSHPSELSLLHSPPSLRLTFKCQSPMVFLYIFSLCPLDSNFYLCEHFSASSPKSYLAAQLRVHTPRCISCKHSNGGGAGRGGGGLRILVFGPLRMSSSFLNARHHHPSKDLSQKPECRLRSPHLLHPLDPFSRQTLPLNFPYRPQAHLPSRSYPTP